MKNLKLKLYFENGEYVLVDATSQELSSKYAIGEYINADFQAGVDMQKIVKVEILEEV